MEAVFFKILLFGISGGEIILILFFILIFFGPKKIPEIARFIGKGVGEIKKVQKEISREVNKYSGDDISKEIQSDIDDYKNKENVVEKGNNKETENKNKNKNKNKNESDSENGNSDNDNSDLPYPYNQAGKFE